MTQLLSSFPFVFSDSRDSKIVNSFAFVAVVGTAVYDTVHHLSVSIIVS